MRKEGRPRDGTVRYRRIKLSVQLMGGYAVWVPFIHITEEEGTTPDARLTHRDLTHSQ